METRRTKVELTYNGSEWGAGMWDSFTYTDPAEGDADEVKIKFFDRASELLKSSEPEKGASFHAKITTQSWEPAPGGGTLDCGELVVDDVSFSGPPTEGEMCAVSTPADSRFRETEKTKTWENVTLEEIGKEIAANAGVSLEWDVENTPPAMKSVEQEEKTDCSFFQEKCNEYGIYVKLYTGKIVAYDREAYKKKDAAATITMKDVESWNWNTTLAHTYTGGTYEYTIPIEKAKDKKVRVTVGGGTRMLHKSGKADNKADAELKIKAAINKANHGAVSMKISTMGRTDLVATQCVNISGFGRADGKYYIDSAEHTVSSTSGFESSFELSKVEEAAE